MFWQKKITLGKQEEHSNKISRDARNSVYFERPLPNQFQSMMGVFCPPQLKTYHISKVSQNKFETLWKHK